MKRVTVKINDLIDEHNQLSAYGQCPGCDLCLEIERVSKAAGLWISTEQLQANNKVAIGKKISANLKKSDIEKYIKDGLTNKEISKIVGLTEKVIGIKIRSWFPNIARPRKRKLSITLDQYKEMRDRGLTTDDIAKQYGISSVCLYNHISALKGWEKRNKGKATC